MKFFQKGDDIEAGDEIKMTMRIGGGRFGIGYKFVKPAIASLKKEAAVKTSKESIDPRKVFAYQLGLKVDEVTANMVRFDVEKINLPKVVGGTRLKFSVDLPEALRGIVEEGEGIKVSLRYSVLPKDKYDRVLGIKVWVRNSTRIIP